MIAFKDAETPEDIEHSRLLFKEYEKAIGVDLCFQGFARELAELPGDYAPPDGCLILAFVDSALAGCAAMRKSADHICEMKRLYVRSNFRGFGLGRSLALEAIRRAVRHGYDKMRLDTLPSMTEAISLYQSLGFVVIEPYRFNPVQGAIYMEKMLH